MGVRIDKSRQNYLACAIDLDQLLTVFLHPGIAERIFRLSDGNDLSAETNYRSISDDSKFAQISAAPRAGPLSLQRNQLSYIGQKYRLIT
jgi:hypothetical protein